MTDPAAREHEIYNPWSVVNLVFHHLAEAGLHPVLGESGDPGAPAAALLRALGIDPAPEGNRQVITAMRSQLEELRLAVFGEPKSKDLPRFVRFRDVSGLSHVESRTASGGGDIGHVRRFGLPQPLTGWRGNSYRRTHRRARGGR